MSQFQVLAKLTATSVAALVTTSGVFFLNIKPFFVKAWVSQAANINVCITDELTHTQVNRFLF